METNTQTNLLDAKEVAKAHKQKELEARKYEETKVVDLKSLFHVDKKLTEMSIEELKSLIRLPFKFVATTYKNGTTGVKASLVLVEKALELEVKTKKSQNSNLPLVDYTYFDTIRMLWGYPENSNAMIMELPVRFTHSQKIKNGELVDYYSWEVLVAKDKRLSGYLISSEIDNLKVRYSKKIFKIKDSKYEFDRVPFVDLTKEEAERIGADEEFLNEDLIGQVTL